MNATRMFRPSARSPRSVACPSARISPFFTSCPSFTSGRWLMAVFWLVRTNLSSSYSTYCASPERICRTSFTDPGATLMTIRLLSTFSTTPSTSEITSAPESRATLCSMPVPTMGASGRISGTAWRCMFEPIKARLASSCSRKGISEAAAETI